MNIALGAVLIFILLMPPIAFYLSFTFVNRQAKAGPKFSLLDGILASAIISLFVHTLAVICISGEIRFDIILKLVGGEIKDVEDKISNREFKTALEDFACYNAVILSISLILGRLARTIVNRFNLDNGARELVRVNNRWYYLFNGVEHGVLSFDLVLIDAVVDTKDGTVIYSGFLKNYVCTGEELDRIYLGDTVRRQFKKPVARNGEDVPNNEVGQPVSIPGNIFSIAYRNIINLNLRFIVIEEDINAIEQLPEEGFDTENGMP